MTSSSEINDFNQLINSTKFFVEYDVLSSLKQEGLKQSDYVEICKRLNRAPNRNELGMFGVMWSEHCCYRNSRPLLKNFPTTTLFIDDQIIEKEDEFFESSYKNQNDYDSYDDWIDNLDIDSSEEFNRMNQQQANINSINEKDLDPWI